MSIKKLGTIAATVATVATLNAESADNKNINAIVSAMKNNAIATAFENGEMPKCSELNSELRKLDENLRIYGYTGTITSENVQNVINDPKFGCEALGGPEYFCEDYKNQLNAAQEGCNEEFDELYKDLRTQAKKAYEDYQKKGPVQMKIPVKKIPVRENPNTDRG